MSQTISIDEFSSVIAEFASYKISIQGCSKKTVEEYLLDLRTFFRFLEAKKRGMSPQDPAFNELDISHIDVKELGKIKPQTIYDFLYYTNDTRNNQWAARSRKLCAIRSLYKFLYNKKHYVESNPTVDIDSPKPKKALPKVLSLEESQRLLQAVEQNTDSPFRVRDYAIVTLFLNCGMRVSELAGINLSDIDSELRSVRVIGKGNKERIVYLNPACQAALIKYLAQRKSSRYAHVHDQALFLSRLEQRISVKMIQAMVYKYLRLAGLESKHYSVHKLRHTAATLMYQSGKVDVRVLKDILGHEQLNTTQIYTHVNNENMEKAMRHNPLAGETMKKKKTSPD